MVHIFAIRTASPPPRHAYRLIDGAEMTENVSHGTQPPPATERPTRLTVSTVRDIEGQDTPAAAQDARGAVGEGRVGESPPIHLHRLHRGRHRGRQECRGFGNAPNSRLELGVDLGDSFPSGNPQLIEGERTGA